MPYRLISSLSLALAAFAASTGGALAAIDDQDEVMAVTAIAVAVFLAVISIGAAIRHVFGLDRMPPPEADAGGHGGHQ